MKKMNKNRNLEKNDFLENATFIPGLANNYFLLIKKLVFHLSFCYSSFICVFCFLDGKTHVYPPILMSYGQGVFG